MGEALRILHLEDSPIDAELVEATLAADGLDCELVRVESRADFLAAIRQAGFELILADYSLPAFDGLSALALARELCPDVPFIFVSGALGEEMAIETLKSGATDYVLKTRLKRLAPAVRRALRETQERVERRRAEEQLSQSERRFRELAEHIRQVFWMTDRRRPEVIYVSPAYEEVWGRTCQSLYEHPDSFLEAVYPDDRDRVRGAIARQLRGEQTEDEYRIIRPDGAVRWIWDRGFPIRDAAGQVSRVAGIAEDITERKQAELGQRLLAEAGIVLANALEYEALAQGLARLVVPRLADWCIVDILEEDQSLRQVTVAHVDPAKEALVRELRQRYPPDGNRTHPISRVLRTGQPEIAPDISDDQLAARARNADHLRLLRELGICAHMVVPLVARGRTLGAISLVSGVSGRHYTPTDLALAEELAHHAGLAVDNARLYARTQALNAELEERVAARTAELEAANLELRSEIEERLRAETQLELSREQLRSLSAHLQAVREEERTGIAREIHDELGGSLTGIKIDIARLRKDRSDDAELMARTKAVTELIDATIQTIRRIATELRPSILDDFGLAAAIEWQLQEFQNRSGVRCGLISNLDDLALAPDQATALFRIFQEALTNVARHANATEVEVTLDVNHSRDVPPERLYLTLQVHDNGRGINPVQLTNPASLGLLGMRERVHLLAGELQISGVPGQGTIVLVRVPLGNAREGVGMAQVKQGEGSKRPT